MHTLSRLPIRLRLTAAFAVAMAAVLAATGLFLYLRLAGSLDQAIDDGLRTRVDDVSALVRQSESGLRLGSGHGLAEQGESFAQVLALDGSLLDTTPQLGDSPLLSPAEVARAAQRPIFLERRSVPGSDDAARLLATSPDLPFASPAVPRLGPVGEGGAALMVMVEMPAAADLDAGILLSGEAGLLFDRMLQAIGLGRSAIYLAPLSPIRTPSGAIDPQSADRLAEIARHHAGLVQPRALLLFGDICGKALLGDAVAGTRGRWHMVETGSGSLKTLATIRPEKLLQTPTLKAFAWADLQLLMDGLKP